MKKISLEQANALLKNLGVVAQVVENKDEADADFELEAFTEESEQSIINSNMAAIKQTLSSEFESNSAKQFGDRERRLAAKQLGVKPAELKDKNLDELFEMVKAKFAAPGTDDNEYLERIKSMQEEHELALTEKESLIAAAHKRYIDRDIDSSLSSYIEKVPRSGGKIGTQTAAFKSWLASNYGDIGYNEEKKALLLHKEGKILLNDKNKEYDFESLAQQFAEESGIAVKDNRQNPPPDAGVYVAPSAQASRQSIDMTKQAESWFGK